MKKLTEIPEKKLVCIEKIATNSEEERLHSLGILPGKFITVIKNPSNNNPLIIEACESRFIISKNLAKNITLKTT